MFYDLIPIIFLRVQYYHPQFTDEESMTQKVGIISVPKCAQLIAQARTAGKDFEDPPVVSWLGSLREEGKSGGILTFYVGYIL